MSDHITSRSHHDTASERSVEDHLHIQLAGAEPADTDCRQGGRSDAEQRVNDSALLGHTCSEDTIETRPVNEQEESADHGDQLTVVVATTTIF